MSKRGIFLSAGGSPPVYMVRAISTNDSGSTGSDNLLQGYQLKGTSFSPLSFSSPRKVNTGIVFCRMSRDANILITFTGSDDASTGRSRGLDVYVKSGDLSYSLASSLTFSGIGFQNEVYLSPSGKTLFIRNSSNGQWEFYQITTNGSITLRQSIGFAYLSQFGTFSFDGQYLITGSNTNNQDYSSALFTRGNASEDTWAGYALSLNSIFPNESNVNNTFSGLAFDDVKSWALASFAGSGFDRVRLATEKVAPFNATASPNYYGQQIMLSGSGGTFTGGLISLASSLSGFASPILVFNNGYVKVLGTNGSYDSEDPVNAIASVSFGQPDGNAPQQYLGYNKFVICAYGHGISYSNAFGVLSFNYATKRYSLIANSPLPYAQNSNYALGGLVIGGKGI